MTEGTSLDDLLNAGTADAAEAAPEPVAEAEPERPRDENGRFAAKETGVEPGAEPETEQPTEAVPPTDKLPKEDYKAIKEEREKRQALERQLEALQGQIQQLQQPSHSEPPPTIWDDEEAAFQYRNGQVVQTAVEQATLQSRMMMSEMLARQANPDFEEMRETFLGLAQENPALAQQALADPHPWNKAYQMAKNHKAMRDLGAVSVDEMRAKLREELLAEMQNGQTPVPQAAALPPTLTGERSVASRTGPAWAGPTPLNDLLR